MASIAVTRKTIRWLESSRDVIEPSDADTESISIDALRAFLLNQDPAWLVDQLLTAALRDPLLRAELDVAAGGDPRSAYDSGALRVSLANAITPRDFVDYRGAYAYVTDVEAALDDVEALIEEGFPDAAIELAEFALDLLEEAIGMVDDSDGGVGAAMRRAEDIHLDACRAGNPNRVTLAERLATRALASDWEIFLNAIPAYADALGDDGMARYREVVADAWRALPPKRAGEHDSGRFRATHLMEHVAAHESTDALIDLMSRDVATSYDVLRIANVLAGDGRHDEALEWAMRGVRDYGSDSRLNTLAAECHLAAGRRDDALPLLWVNFAEHPALETYQELHAAAGEAMAPWRDKALHLLRDQPPAPLPGPSAGRRAWAEPPGHSTLVGVLLWEGDIDAAWSAAQEGGCRPPIWLQLARERAKDHPADALPVVIREAENTIEDKQRSAYQYAAQLLQEATTLAARCGEDADFRQYVRSLRMRHQRRPALQDELNKAGLPS